MSAAFAGLTTLTTSVPAAAISNARMMMPLPVPASIGRDNFRAAKQRAQCFGEGRRQRKIDNVDLVAKISRIQKPPRARVNRSPAGLRFIAAI
jgi:hypothetical protein